MDYLKEKIKDNLILTIFLMPLVLIGIFGYIGIKDLIHKNHYYFLTYVISFLRDSISTFGAFFTFDLIIDLFALPFKKHKKEKNKQK